MKKTRGLIILSAVLGLNLWAGEYIADLSTDEAVSLDSREGRDELKALLDERMRNRDSSPIVIAYSAQYDVTNLQIHLPLAGAVGRVLNHVPVVGGLFNRLFQNFDPPRSLTLRALLFPAAEAKGFLLGVHGLQSNARWYEKTGRALAERGVTSLFFDRRGSGMSDSVIDGNGRPMRGHHASSALDHLLAAPKELALGDASEFLEDIHVSYEHLFLVRRMQGSQSPIHLYANCFGARVVFAYAQEWDDPREAFASIITTSPGTNMRKGDLTNVRDRLQVISLPELYQSIQLTDTDFTTNPDALEEMGNSRLSLILRKVTNRFLLSAGGLTHKMKEAFRNTSRNTFRNNKLAQIPTLVVIPSRDEIIFTDETHNTFAETYPGPTLVTWLKSEHMIEFDDQAQSDLVGVISQWIYNQEAGWAGYKGPANYAEHLRIQARGIALPTLIEEKLAAYRD